MTGTAGSAAVISASAAFLRDARVRTLVDRRPVVYRMAGRAIQAKHTGMKNRIIMTARTGGR